MTDLTTSDRREPALLQRVPLVASSIISVASVIVLLVSLVLASLVVGAAGLTLGARATSGRAADRAAKVVSVGFGLAVGPAVYMILAAILAIAS